mmetsp:Transcript_79511/g.223392  ORF Transcript_79511/g.223392 Transcript_79511/m.223392 type:complete len:252 (-) Transcript_79511:508-1263(-)
MCRHRRGRQLHVYGRRQRNFVHGSCHARCRLASGDQHVRSRIDTRQVNIEEASRASSCGEIRIVSLEHLSLAIGKGKSGHLARALKGHHTVVLGVALAASATHCHDVGVDRAAIEVMQRLPAASDHLALHWGAVFERAPTTCRPNLIQLPDDASELVLRAARLNIGLHVQSLRDHALVQVLLEDGLSRSVEVGVGPVAEIDIDQVVARVVPLRHHVVPLAGVQEAAGALVAGLARVQAPMLLRQCRRHGLE